MTVVLSNGIYERKNKLGRPGHKGRQKRKLSLAELPLHEGAWGVGV
jgi:hypothetical protein